MARMMTRWEPLREMVGLREAMDRLFEDSFVRPAWNTPGEGDRSYVYRLPADAYSTENELVITASVPGANPDEVEITIEGDTLTIKGEVPAPLSNVNYIMQERGYGRFSRTLTLNVPVQADKAEAEFVNGVLTLRVPKAEAVRPRTIKVTTK
jgi:HSP20 family protein